MAKKEMEDKGTVKTSASAILRYYRVSPRKARLVADLVRGKNLQEAIRLLTFTRKKSAQPIAKLLKSAMANATQQNSELDIDKLFVKTIFVDEGPMMKRFIPRAMGRATRVNKKSSHVTVVVSSY
jgi:large subunit ribosomal protein L22